MPQRLAIEVDIARQHQQQAVTVGRVACFDHQIEKHAALPVVGLSLWPYSVSQPPLTVMSACGSNRLTNFSPAGTGLPTNSRRSPWTVMHAISGRW
jgi:hypothetical protein